MTFTAATAAAAAAHAICTIIVEPITRLADHAAGHPDDNPTLIDEQVTPSHTIT